SVASAGPAAAGTISIDSFAALPAADDHFLVPPAAVLSLLSLLRHHLGRTTAEVDLRMNKCTSTTKSNNSCTMVTRVKEHLSQFTREVLWRLFLTLKEYFLFLRFR
ncbi:unnamed protein product, partial [Amoebophrya sp. A120]